MTIAAYQTVIDMLTSDINDLKKLALMSGREIFTFYNGASLRDLDLMGQDLTGMNFRNADIRFAKMEGASFDKGAFNGCMIDDTQYWLIDDYEYYVQDIENFPITEILAFVKIRAGMIDSFLTYTNQSYTDFCKKISVSANALRKARRGEVIAFETALKIITGLNNIATLSVESGDCHLINSIRQPFTQILSGGLHGDFRPLSRKRLEELLEMRKEISTLISNIYPKNINSKWRNTPESIVWMLPYYKSL